MHSITTSPTSGRSARRFIRHYIEMVVAMLAGMIVLGLPGEALLRAVGSGSDELQASAPEVALLAMALIMTVPMVAWMRHHGHAWRPCHEMAASMFVPTFGIIGLMWAGTIDSFGAAMGLEHVAMLPAMLAVMLLRIDEYATPHVHHDHGHRRPATA